MIEFCSLIAKMIGIESYKTKLKNTKKKEQDDRKKVEHLVRKILNYFYYNGQEQKADTKRTPNYPSET